MLDIPPVPPVLDGRAVRLEPLTLDHLPRLVEVGAADTTIFDQFLVPLRTADDVREWVESGVADGLAGRVLPFATVLRETGLAVGSTRFANIDAAHGRLEIGWTWIARPWQRTAVNTEAKLLMLSWAFETLGARRVELKTDARNARSRAAMRRIGATEEGTLRRHMVRADGTSRDSVYFSVIAEEWPAVRERLVAMRDRPAAAATLPIA